MIEYRTERVNPQAEDSVTEILGAFGWVPVSSQEVYNESTSLDGIEVKAYGSFMQGWTGKDGEINIKQRKNITNYTVIKFGRDTQMPNYQRISELNEEFERKMSVKVPKKPAKRTAITAIGIFIILVSIILAVVESNSAEIWEICVCVIFPLVMVPITVFGWIKYKSNMKSYYFIQQQLNEIYDEAVALLE